MSVSNILDDGGEPQLWSNLNVNSIKAKNFYINSTLPTGTSSVYVNNQTGDDANTGLSESAAVATMGRAYEVALKNLPAASTVVFRLAGSGNLSMGEQASGLPDGFKVVDLNGLSLKFAVIKFLGAITNVQAVDAGSATASADTSFNSFTRYTFGGGETLEHNYANGFLYNSSKYPEYRGLYFADTVGAAFVRVLGANDGIEAAGFQLHTLTGPLLTFGENNCAILSQVPVVFERCQINSATTDGYVLKNLSASPVSYHGCHLFIRNSGWLDSGEFSLFGCILSGSDFDKQLQTDNAKVGLHNSNIFCKLLAENEMTINYCQGTNAAVVLRASASNIDDSLFSCGQNFNKHILECTASTLRCDRLRISGYQSDAAYNVLYSEDSVVSLYNTDIERYVESDAALANCVQLYNSNLSFEGAKTVVACNNLANGSAINAETSNILIRGDTSGQRVFRSIGGPVFQLDNSQLVIDGMTTPASDGFTCASDHVALVHNSKIDLPENPPYIASPVSAFKAQGISQIQVKAPAGYANAGAGALYTLNAVSSDAFAAGYTSNSTGGFCQLIVLTD